MQLIWKETYAQSLRLKVCHILSGNLKIKVLGQSLKSQRKTLVEIKNRKYTKIFQFDKSLGSVVLSEKNAIQKTEEQLGKAKITENDLTLRFANKIQKILCRLRKENKVYR